MFRKGIDEGGFTLVELMVTIMIISILTVITVSQFQTAKKKANDAQRKGDLNALNKALQMYYADYGVFPAASNMAIGGSLGLTGAYWGGTFQDSGVPPYVYMKKLPRENYQTTKPYCYKVSADFKQFALFAQLENWTDKECDRDIDGVSNDTTMNCGGGLYCYEIHSPNATVSTNGTLQ